MIVEEAMKEAYHGWIPVEDGHHNQTFEEELGFELKVYQSNH